MQKHSHIEASVLALLASLFGGCVKTVPDNTSVHISVTSDIADLDDKVQIQATLAAPGTTLKPKDLTFTLDQARTGFVLLPHSSRNEMFSVKAVGLKNGTPVVSKTVSSHFVAGQPANLAIVLSARCKGVLCDAPPGQTCDTGSCKPVPAITPTTTPDSPYDGGVDAAKTDVPQTDDAARDNDGGSETQDGATDAGCDPNAQIGNGFPCSCDTECANQHCVAGICCDTACTGTCRSCDLPGSLGKCTLVAAGNKPAQAAECAADEVSNCGFDGTCDGMGACRKYSDGTVCQPGKCDAAGANITGTRTCLSGTCAEIQPQPCAPFGCDGTKNACFETCTDDHQCTTGNACKDNSCGQKANGGSCTKSADCVSGICADAVCCNARCDGQCEVCNLTGYAGKCTPVAAGQADPRAQCKDQQNSNCGTTGLCDGKGACALYAQATACSTAVCSVGNSVPASTCDGNGACVAGNTVECAPYRCSNATGACIKICGSDNDCASPNKCLNGSCGLKGVGQSCEGNAECLSNSCADGVCCDNSCTGACQACNIAGHVGTCTYVPASATAPHLGCSDNGAISCGTDGKCDGNGACRKYPSGTQCAPPSCDMGANQQLGRSLCNGDGKCVPGAKQSCTPFLCNGNNCSTTCTDDNQCAPPNSCVGNSCGKRSNGTTCSKAAECSSNYCVLGVCCDQACSGSCDICSTGTCATSCAADGGLLDAANDGRADDVRPDDVTNEVGSDQDGSACNGSSSCPSCPKRAFATTNSFYSDFGGIVAADSICQSEAKDAGLCGTWMAWLADDTLSLSPATRFTRSTTGYVRLDGVMIASSYSDLTDGTLSASINVTASGSNIGPGLAWTDVDVDGSASWSSQHFNPGSCTNWTSRAGAGGAGRIEKSDSEWTISQINPCNGIGTRLHLYCFEQ